MSDKIHNLIKEKRKKKQISHGWLLYSVTKQNVFQNVILVDSQHYSFRQVISQPKRMSELQTQFLELMKMSQTFCVVNLLNVEKVKH